MLETKRLETNAVRLLELNPFFRAKVRAVIADLERNGLRPLIATGYRSAAEEAKKKAGGFSKVSFGLHNCRNAKGQPDALAADVVDADTGWDAPKSFWLMLASSAQAHGLTSGAFWGLSQAARAKIRAFIGAKSWKVAVALGWDAAHIEWKGITLGQAKAGVRPKGFPSAKA